MAAIDVRSVVVISVDFRSDLMASRIVAKKLEKRFGQIHAVRGIDLEVPAGQVLGFLGPNGAGKSTTMRMITGFLEPTAGSVHLEGINLAEDPIAAKRTFGYLPEGAPAYPDMTVEEFLGFIAHARGFRGREVKERVERSIGRVNLQGVRRQAFETLSSCEGCWNHKSLGRLRFAEMRVTWRLSIQPSFLWKPRLTMCRTGSRQTWLFMHRWHWRPTTNWSVCKCRAWSRSYAR